MELHYTVASKPLTRDSSLHYFPLKQLSAHFSLFGLTVPGNRDTKLRTRATMPRAPITQHISGVNAETGGRLLAGYSDNSNNSEYYGGTHYHQQQGIQFIFWGEN